MLAAVELCKFYYTDDVETLALNNVCFTFSKGEFIAIMGPSGCGKSTLLNIIGLIDTPSSGFYFFDGQEVGGFSESKRNNIRKGNIGFVFQNFNLIDEATVQENVELPLVYLSIGKSERKGMVRKVLSIKAGKYYLQKSQDENIYCIFIFSDIFI